MPPHRTPVSFRATGFLALLMLPAAATAQFVEHDVEIIHEFHGTTNGDNLGAQVCAVADYNGDGAMEFLIGIAGEDDGVPNGGAVALYDGATGTKIRIHYGTQLNEQVQYVCDAGDVDGDGIMDYLYGSTKDRVRVHSGADGALLHHLVGVTGEQFGFRACGIGDINDDGHGDVLVGAWGSDTLGTDRGKAYIYSGIDGALLREQDGPFASSRFGHTVSRLGDLDGDGVADYSVGAPGPWGTAIRGQIYVYSGATGAEVYPHLNAHNTGIALAGWQQTHGGYDINGDGVPDYAGCDIGDYAGGTSAGRLYVYDGATGAEIYTVTGYTANSGFGGLPWTDAGAIGDVDGDCVSDFLVASWRSQVGASQAGQAHILSGATGTLLRDITGNHANAFLAGTLSGAGDANGDGIADYILGANGDDGGKGAVYVIAGIDHRPVPGDISGDGAVGFDDLLMLLANWGPTAIGAPGDFDCDRTIGFSDLVFLLANWG